MGAQLEFKYRKSKTKAKTIILLPNVGFYLKRIFTKKNFSRCFNALPSLASESSKIWLQKSKTKKVYELRYFEISIYMVQLLRKKIYLRIYIE